MTHALTVSQEFLKPGASPSLGIELLAAVEALMALEDTPERRAVLAAQAATLSETIHRHTNLTVTVKVLPDDGRTAGIMSVGASIIGSRGTDGKHLHQRRPKVTSTDGKLLQSEIDLTTGRVSGGLAEYPSVLVISEGYFTSSDFTPREVTALLLHEVGHLFFALATIGEFVWVHYYLTEGVEVLLGKAPNKYRVDILDRRYLAKQVTDPELRQRIESDPNPGNLRRAILDQVRTRRDQLNSPLGRIRRDEQLADLYVSRQGFARDLATVVYKVDRSRGRYYLTSVGFRAAETLKVVSALLATTAVLLQVAMIAAVITAILLVTDEVIQRRDRGLTSGYDTPTERISKLKRDLIGQLKRVDLDPQHRQLLLDDIAAIETLLSTMNQHATVVEAIEKVLVPTTRRAAQRYDHEVLLESLLNNDVFTQAAKFRRPSLLERYT